MNRQGRVIDGRVVGGIEWTKTVRPDGTERPGYTWNPVAGCRHGCRWQMPDGTTAICYAEETANGVAESAYPDGFEHHYWHPHRLEEPLRVQEPARILLDSMADLMGHWVPEVQVNTVLSVCVCAHWHTFQLLTKNAPRLLKFVFPPNVWVGVSSPPDVMFGKPLSRLQQIAMLERSLTVLAQVKAAVRWMSVEPLSWDVAPVFERYPRLDWVVIGAASNGADYYQPDSRHVANLLAVLDRQRVPVFFKGNLEWEPWREFFPVVGESHA